MIHAWARMPSFELKPQRPAHVSHPARSSVLRRVCFSRGLTTNEPRSLSYRSMSWFGFGKSPDTSSDKLLVQVRRRRDLILTCLHLFSYLFPSTAGTLSTLFSTSSSFSIRKSYGASTRSMLPLWNKNTLSGSFTPPSSERQTFSRRQW